MAACDARELRKFVSPEIVFGEGAIDLTGQYASGYSACKVLLVTDPGVRAAGWAGAAEKSLKEAGIAYAVFEGVTPNPKDHEAMAGAEVYRSEKCDVIVVVGGGSPMDCAKAIGIVVTNNRHVLAFEGLDEVVVPGPPLLCIPTTAGSAADVSQFAVITDTARKVKIAIISKTMVPDVALIDPSTTLTMSAQLTAATGVDALVHALEAYVSNASSPLTDLNALEAIRLINRCLPAAVHEPKNIASRNGMMMGSLLAGLAFSNASLGLVHSMAHALGGRLDMAHGDCNAILLEHVVLFNFAAAAERYRAAGRAMGLDLEGLPTDGARLADALSQFRRGVGIHQTLGQMGVRPGDIPAMAHDAFNDPCLATNPTQPTLRDIEVLYEQAL
ncbi:MAG: iron-containing alcohol dehydrogenase [Deltaproteobacteria bacterium]|nr:iron-containing alcohol dehydrogenase [Deltaproteobacteria bacterium]